MEEPRTFRDGVLDGHRSLRGFRVLATDGPAGRVSWAGYEPGESYLVLTTGWLRKIHRVLPAGAVTRVGEEEVQVELSRAEIEHLPRLRNPQAQLDDGTSPLEIVF